MVPKPLQNCSGSTELLVNVLEGHAVAKGRRLLRIPAFNACVPFCLNTDPATADLGDILIEHSLSDGRASLNRPSLLTARPACPERSQRP